MSSSKKKHTLFLRDGDFDALADYYGPQGFKASEIVRILVSAHVDKIASSDSLSAPKINVEIEI